MAPQEHPSSPGSPETLKEADDAAQIALANRLFFRLYQCANMLHKTGSRAVEAEGLTTQQWAVLGAVSRPEAARGMGINELARYLMVSRQNLSGLIGRMDYIQGLGATAIWLGPIYQNKPVQGGPGEETAGYHGYWITDFTRVDPHFGNDADMRAFWNRHRGVVDQEFPRHAERYVVEYDHGGSL